MAFKVYLGILQEKNLKAEEEHRRQQKERAEMEKLRQAEERKRFVLQTVRACVVDTEDLYIQDSQTCITSDSSKKVPLFSKQHPKSV